MDKHAGIAFVQGREDGVEGFVTQICAIGVGVQSHADKTKGI